MTSPEKPKPQKQHPYEHALILTSPHMRGQRVRDAQWLLAGHNVWSDNASPIHTYYGRIDSEYGPATYGASKRAKFWLGYPDSEIDGSFGKLLFNLLHGDSHLSAEFARRRAERVKKNADPLKVKALEIARKEIGVRESPFGSNMQKFGVWYGMNGVPWCAIFCSWAISQAGHPWKYSYVPNISADAVQGRNGMSVTYSPQPGDLVCYTIGDTVDAHVAFFDTWVSGQQQEFYDLGGNTGPTNIANGGAVMRQIRYVGMVHRFVRLTL